MIIDSHVHWVVQEWIGQRFWEAWVWLSSRLAGKDEDRIRKRLPDLWDPGGDKLISDMDEAGIDKSVIFPMDFGLAANVGEAPVSISEVNKAYADLSAKHPQRLIALVGVDPRRKEAPFLLEQAIKDWKMRGLKFHPATGFYPCDAVAYPLYETIEKFSLPVVIHTGPAAHPLYSQYAQPIHIDKAAADFPGVNFIMAHMGYGWYSEAVSLAANKPNIYLDLSGWQREFHGSPKEFYSVLRLALNMLGKERILFGSDW
ncbi:MAG: amidohydrolase family protein, partial [Methanothrix sp.]|nr:amidohydrolase family protein [Methanothrix sp.]